MEPAAISAALRAARVASAKPPPRFCGATRGFGAVRNRIGAAACVRAWVFSPHPLRLPFHEEGERPKRVHDVADSHPHGPLRAPRGGCAALPRVARQTPPLAASAPRGRLTVETRMGNPPPHPNVWQRGCLCRTLPNARQRWWAVPRPPQRVATVVGCAEPFCVVDSLQGAPAPFSVLSLRAEATPYLAKRLTWRRSCGLLRSRRGGIARSGLTRCFVEIYYARLYSRSL